LPAWTWAIVGAGFGLFVGMIVLLLVLAMFGVGADEDEARRRWIDDQYRRGRDEGS
jgi:hypothetical protein